MNNAVLNGNEEPYFGDDDLDLSAARVVKIGGSDTNLATSETEILENFPFTGHLLKWTGNGYHRIRTYDENMPGTVEDIKTNYGHGQYQIRANSGEKEIKVTLAIEKPVTPPVESQGRRYINKHEDDAFIESLENQIEKTLREKYTQEIETLKQKFEIERERLQDRIERKEELLDEKSQKIRGLDEEIGRLRNHETERIHAAVTPLQDRIDQMREERLELKNEITRLQLQAEFTDDGSESPKSMGELIINALTENPQILEKFGPAIEKLVSRGSATAPPAVPQNTAQPTPTAPATTESQPLTEQEVNEAIRDFSIRILNKAADQLSQKNPSASTVKKFVDGQLKGLNERGITPNAQTWVGIARAMINLSDEKGFHPNQVAVLLQPILDQFGQAKVVLKTVSAEQAATMLNGMYGLNLEPHEQQFLVSALDYFKKHLK